MKKLLKTIGAAMLLLICGNVSVFASDNQCGEATTPAARLAGRLARVAESGKVAFGHHDDTAYGHTWKYRKNRSDVKSVCGDYPAVMNWDLGLIEWETDKQLDGVPFEFIRKEVVKQDARGGVNAFSWHVRNPLSKGDSWNCEGGDVIAQCLKQGTALNDTIRTWIGRVADFLGSLRDAKGNRIAVIFRPWHEHTGSWFWWGYDFCTAQEYKALWQLTREVFDEKGIDNVLWVYSPDKDHVSDVESYLQRYPGDELVDIMGGDVYHFDAEAGVELYLERVKQVIGSAVEAARSHGKLVAFTETGLESVAMANWWTEVLLPAIADYPICYVVVWRNAHDKPGHFYAPYPGHPSVPSFKQFVGSNRIITAKGLKNIK
ncbi:MAG: glycoside hydrolase family 26 protein [Muribaculaceae bacterium]